jgi:hypothetical protein
VARDVDFNLTASDKTGPALSKAEREFRETNARIEKEQERAARALARTRETEARKSADKIRRDQEKAGNDFLKIAGTIAGAGSKIGVLFGENLAGSLSKMAPALTPVLAGVAAASAPLIGASISGAIIGGAGIGGVVGGITLAAKDPRVAAAGSALGQTIMGQLRSRAAVFIEPTLDAIQQIDDGFGAIGANVGRIFQASQRYVKPLTSGILSAGESLSGLVAKLAEAAGPVMEIISRGIAGIGEAVDIAFSMLADNGIDSAVALNQVFQLLEVSIVGVGAALNALTESYGFLAKLGLFGRDAQQEYLRLSLNAQLAADSNADVAITLEAVRAAGQGVAGVISNLTEEIGDLTGANNTLYASTTNAAEAIARTTEKINDNGKGLSLNTQKGRENRAALSDLAGALNRNYDAYVAVNGAGKGAEGVARRNRDAFIALAEKAGYASGKARELANKLLGIPAKRTPVVNLKDQASGKIQTVIERLAAVRSKTVTVNVAVRQSGDAAALRKQNLPAFRAGSTFATVGEAGGMSRTAPPTPVQVASTVNVALDGTPFYAYTARAVEESQRRARWRQKVGTR